MWTVSMEKYWKHLSEQESALTEIYFLNKVVVWIIFRIRRVTIVYPDSRKQPEEENISGKYGW